MWRSPIKEARSPAAVYSPFLRLMQAADTLSFGSNLKVHDLQTALVASGGLLGPLGPRLTWSCLLASNAGTVSGSLQEAR